MKKKILACVLTLMLVFASSAFVYASAFAGNDADYAPITATGGGTQHMNGGSAPPPPGTVPGGGGGGGGVDRVYPT